MSLASHGTTQLTNRERELLAALARGLSTKEIAHLLMISEHTVSKHRKNICKKLGVHSTAELIVFAVIHSWPAPNKTNDIPSKGN